MSTRNYVRDASTATTGLAITIQAKGRLKQIIITTINAAAGVVEVSTNPSSLIGTADPGIVVLARLAGGISPFPAILSVPCDIPVVAFQQIFVHQSGAANTSVVNLCVQEA